MFINKNSRTSKKLHKGMLCFYCTCTLILLFAFGIMIFRMVLQSQLNAKLNAIRAAGYPATLAELNEYYPQVPDDVNAAPLYKQASTLMRSPYEKIFKNDNKNKTALDQLFADEFNGKSDDAPPAFPQLVMMVGSAPNPILGEHLISKSLIANQRFIAANQPSIKMLNQAVTRVKSRFPMDLRRYIFSLHHLNYLRSLTSLLSLNTIIAAETNNRQLATENILTMLKMCHAMDNEPVLISYLVSITMQAKTITTIEYLLNLVELDDNNLQQISDALQNCLAQQDKNFHRALIGERTTIININRKCAEYYKIPYQFDKFTGILTLNKLKIIELYDSLFAITAKCNGITIKYDIDKFKQQLKALPYFYMMPKKLLPNLTNAIYKKLRIKIQLEVAIIGIAIERYRLKYHKLPKKLTQLVPEFIKQLPNDPFTGKPFHYIVGDIELEISEAEKGNYPQSYTRSKIIDYNGNPLLWIKRSGWMVYSLGRNQNDDGGISMPRGTPDDIPFRCVRKDNNPQ